MGALEARHPALEALGGHRLGDAQPYVLPREGELLWFLCRWEEPGALRVALDASLEPRERELVERALGAWQQALPALQWRIVPDDEADLVVAVGGVSGGFSAQTAVDCGVALPAGDPVPPRVLPARLVRARIALRRSERDARGKEVPLAEEELLGSALHEIGHALGFQGHARRGDTIMRPDVEAVRRAGRRVLAGQPFRDEVLPALYRVPSGVRVGVSRVGVSRTSPLDALARIALREDLPGPFVRVGDRSARVAWREGEEWLGVWLPDIGDVLRHPERFTILPDPNAARRLRDAPREAAAGERGAEPAPAPPAGPSP